MILRAKFLLAALLVLRSSDTSSSGCGIATASDPGSISREESVSNAWIMFT
jgi:hypothetical protein